MPRRFRTNITGEPLKKYVCRACKNNNCGNCVDVLRAAFSIDMICKCGKANHSGEPISQQILDPETGTVHAPGLTVTQDGEVSFNEGCSKEKD